jgi:hypothetical protein
MVQSKLRPKSSLESRPKLEILGGATKEEWGRKRSFFFTFMFLLSGLLSIVYDWAVCAT